jgi:hypothetical protein
MTIALCSPFLRASGSLVDMLLRNVGICLPKLCFPELSTGYCSRHRRVELRSKLE